MAYDKDKIYNQAILISKKKGYFYMQDIIDSLCIAKSTFYSFFPEDSNQLDTLKSNLYKNRIDEKIKLRKKLGEGSGSELIALYKLIGNDEERRALSTNWTESKLELDEKSKINLTINNDNIDLSTQ